MDKTIREMVREIEDELRETDVPPSRARALLVKLTGLSGSCMEEIRMADRAYNVVLLACLDGEEAASRAKIRAEVSPEFERKREAHDYHALVIEMIRSLKVMLRSLDTEMSLSR
jgi:hypothetical protein